MYICLCNAVTDSQIKDCAKDGCTLSELRNKLNVANCCGCCLEEVKQLYKEVTLRDN